MVIAVNGINKTNIFERLFYGLKYKIKTTSLTSGFDSFILFFFVCVKFLDSRLVCLYLLG